MSETRCLILLVHGSKDPRWRAPFELLAADVAQRLGDVPSRPGRTALAYMEFAEPTLMDAATRLHADGASEFAVLPVFLAAGAHVATDIPEQIQAVRERLPGVHIELMQPLGEHPRFQALLRELIVEIARETTTVG